MMAINVPISLLGAALAAVFFSSGEDVKELPGKSTIDDSPAPPKKGKKKK